MSAVPARRWDAASISAMLASRIDGLVPEILPGAKRDGMEWRVGSVAGDPGGSLGIHRTGQKAGVWSDFSTGEVGDVLDLVAAVLTRGDLGQALKWAIGWLGVGDAGPVRVQRADMPAEAPQQAVTDEDARKKAQAMWLRAQPSVINTPVDGYLQARGIDLRQFDRQLRALRFAPQLWNAEISRNLPCMVAAITNGAGVHIATHRTWLARGADGVWRKAPLRAAKKVRGQMRGGSIRLWRGSSGKPIAEMPEDETVAIGEGIETCLSVALMCPELRVIAAANLGNMAVVELPPQCRRVLILADNDAEPKAVSGLQRAVNAHIAAGRTVDVARSRKGKDFNDALR